METSETAPRGPALPRLWAGLIALIYPPLCPVCAEPVAGGAGLCPTCWTAIHFLDGAVCSQCGTPFEVDPGSPTLCAACLAKPPAYAAARAVMRYDDASKPPILALKHADRLDLAPTLSEWMARTGRAMLAEADLIVPVPLHWRRLWKRRYNQSAELARPLARKAGIVFAPEVLSRRRPTPSQGEMPSAKARRRNVLGAFRVPPRRKPDVAGKTVLVIDDVMTTGATAEACTRALMRAGAKKVYVLALARAVRAPQALI